MVAGGYSSRGLPFAALGYAEEEIPSFLTGLGVSAATLAISVLELIIALGGLAVLAGGLLILFHHARTGRVMVYLGGGTGLFGLLISFGYAAYRLGPASAIAYAPYWVGLAMAAGSRRLAKGA